MVKSVFRIATLTRGPDSRASNQNSGSGRVLA